MKGGNGTRRIMISRDEERDILFGVINRFLGYFTRDSQRESINDPGTEYPFVPMDTRQVFDQILLAREELRARQGEDVELSFIDIGCGIGNVLLFAEMMGFRVAGIEKDIFPCRVAQKLFDERAVTPTDIWEFEEFSRFDVVYYFRPFHDGNMQRRFEEYIEDRVRPGGVLIANRKMSDKIETDPRFSRLRPDMPVWARRP